MTQLYLIRYAEIGLKGRRKRGSMEKRLISNMKAAFPERTIPELRLERGRIFASFPDELPCEQIDSRLQKIFGIKSFSRCHLVEITGLDDLVQKAGSFFASLVSGKKFAVRVRRAGSHEFTSLDAERVVGEALLPHASGVDLVRPEFTAFIEIREKTAYFFTDTTEGPGGFPLGTQGRMVALVSGGIDSPVAAWMIMKRGCLTDFVFCSLAHPFDTVEFLRTVSPLIKDWSPGANFNIHVFDGRPLVELLVEGKGFSHPNVGFKKFLYQLAEAVSFRNRAYGIITGESLGQVSSQTAENLYALSKCITTPIHRPLIGLDKDEIIEISKKIDTFPKESLGEFCSIFSLKPTIAVNPSDLIQDQVPDSIIAEIMETEVLVRKSDFAQYLETLKERRFQKAESIPDGVLVDLRTEQKFMEWHPDGAVNIPVSRIADLPDRFGKDKTYVFYCSQGLMSAFAASKFAGMGINAAYSDENQIRKKYKKEKK